MTDASTTEPTPRGSSSANGPPLSAGNGEVTAARRDSDSGLLPAVRLRLADLQQALSAAEPAAVLVAPRVLERVARLTHQLPAMAWQVPHKQSCIVARNVLFRYVEQDELEIEPDRLLPPTVILLARPTPEALLGPSEQVLLDYWRRLFHASIHLALEHRTSEGKLEPEEIRARIRELGAAEFEEIRTVLTQEHYLATDADERSVYCEFAAVYLELKCFAPALLPVYFPALGDGPRVEALLTRDVEADNLLRASRLQGAPEPGCRRDDDSAAPEAYQRLMRRAAAATTCGNLVRAALTLRQAVRLAPATLVSQTEAQASASLQRLAARLREALQLSESDGEAWLRLLPALLDKAEQGKQTAEAGLLYDLQKVCLDHERPLYSLDVAQWLLSAGRRPIKRPLPCQRLVRMVRHLRSAAGRLAQLRLADSERQEVSALLHSAAQALGERMRSRFRPLLSDALHDVGLTPTNALERTAFAKMVEEMLDRISGYGFLTFGDLRDTLSRNQLKLPDLADPQQFISGDPLLRLDRRLAALLDGVYRPSDLCMRCLERLTALSFGTAAGRLLTRFVTIPFGGAFVLCMAVLLLLKELHVEISMAIQLGVWLATGTFLLGLLQSRTLRQRCYRAAAGALRSARRIMIELPPRVLPLTLMRRALTSWPAQLCYWYLLKPGVICGLLWLWMPDAFTTVLGAAGIFLAVNFLLNSRVGKAAGELALGSIISFYELLRAGLLPGLYRVVVRGFKQALDAAELVLFSVDEWLSFRSGDRWPSLALRAGLSVLWSPISYVARLYMLVLVEPAINPVKMPVSYMAAKLLMAFEPAMIAFGVGLLSSVTGVIVATIIVWPTVWLSPDVFGFLFWEMKENWYLFRANRAATLRPVPVGPHQETLVHLLRPGFHSGTVPRLFARLRHADPRAAAACRQTLGEIQQSVRLFVRRELCTLLEQTPAWQAQPLSVGEVTLSCNRVSIELLHAAYPDRAMWLEFENRATWLVAGFRASGWLSDLSAEQRQLFLAALVILYKLAGVDLVREQLTAHLPSSVTLLDITAQGLTAWLPTGEALRYDLRGPGAALEPRPADGGVATDSPALPAEAAIFARMPVSWQACAAGWPDGQNSASLPQIPLLA